jgi:hypothetical protein
LGEFGEEIMNLGFSHLFSDFEEDVTIHVVPVNIFDGVVEAISWDFLLRSGEIIKLLLISLADMNECLTIERIKDGSGSFGLISFTIENVIDGVRVFGTKVVGINSGPSGES